MTDVGFDSVSLQALKELLNLVHYDDLASEFRKMLPHPFNDQHALNRAIVNQLAAESATRIAQDVRDFGVG